MYISGRWKFESGFFFFADAKRVKELVRDILFSLFMFVLA